MTELEKANKFIDHLMYVEDISTISTIGVGEGYPVELSRLQTMKISNNCKIKQLAPSFLTTNPYFKNINIGNWRVGNIYLNKKEFYMAGRTYVLDERKRNKETLEPMYEFFYFPSNVCYPVLGEVSPDTKWMGVELAEINSFDSFIKEANGKVLLMGCGLGYLAYMLSLKDDVEEVTIIELDKDVIGMFQKYLKPQMNNKINIVHGDAIECLERADISRYQYCSVDIWRGTKDMLPIYLKCLLFEQNHPNTKFHYWLEKDLHVALESVWIGLLKALINKKNLDGDSEIFTDILTMQSIETVEDIRKFIAADKRPFISDWALKNSNDAYNYEGLSKTLEKVQKKLQ